MISLCTYTTHVTVYSPSKLCSILRPYSHEAKAEAKGKKIFKKRKRSKTKRQTSKKIFTFTFAFARSEHSLTCWNTFPYCSQYTGLIQLFCQLARSRICASSFYSEIDWNNSTFQPNTKHLLLDRCLGYIVKQFEHVWGRGKSLYGEI